MKCNECGYWEKGSCVLGACAFLTDFVMRFCKLCQHKLKGKMCLNPDCFHYYYLQNEEQTNEKWDRILKNKVH